MDAAAIAALLQRRFSGLDQGLEADLKACEEAAGADNLHPKKALQLVQMLAAHTELLKAAAKPGALSGLSKAEEVELISQERAS